MRPLSAAHFWAGQQLTLKTVNRTRIGAAIDHSGFRQALNFGPGPAVGGIAMSGRIVGRPLNQGITCEV